MKHLILLIDALGKSAINDKNSPRIHNFFHQGTFTNVRTLLGYSNAIIPSIFSGVYPSKHGVWGLYKLSPNSTPFSWAKFFPALLFDRNLVVRYLANKIIFSAAKRERKVPSYMEPANVPIGILKYFDISMKTHFTDPNCLGQTPTLFDEFRRKKIDFSYFGFPWHKGTSNILRLARNALNGDREIVVAYVDEIDHSEHLYGTESKQFLGDLRLFDEICADFLLKSEKAKNTTITAFSDHGMRDVSGTINLLQIIQQLPLKIEKDFMMFLDSTIARFWFYNQKAKEMIFEALSGANGGRFLLNDEITKYNINFDSDLYGHYIYLADPGKIILPNFYTIRGGTVKAMHGWSPEDPLQDSFYFNNDSSVRTLLTDVSKIYFALKETIGI